MDEEMQRELPPPPTAEEIEQVRAAYEATAERLDTMMRSQNLGAEAVPPMDFTRLVQSIYMSAMMQLGAGTQQGQQARVDLIGAKQSIDMLGVISDKAGTNLSSVETQLIDAALFELRMGFLEITQLLARQAAAKQQAPASGPTGAGGFGASGFTGAGPEDCPLACQIRKQLRRGWQICFSWAPARPWACLRLAVSARSAARPIRVTTVCGHPLRCGITTASC